MLHTFPDARQVVVAVREFLETEVAAAAPGAVAFHARVAANLLTALERELAAGGADEARFRAALAGLGVRDEAELAARIRDGETAPGLTAALLAITTDRLRAWNPAWLDDADDDDPRRAP